VREDALQGLQVRDQLLFEQAQVRGEVTPGQDVTLVADSYAYLWFMLWMQWLANGDELLLAPRMRSLVDLILDGCRRSAL